MKHLITCLALVVSLAGCGGGGGDPAAPSRSGPIATVLALVTPARTVELFWGARPEYTVIASGDQLAIDVKDNIGADGLRVVQGPATLQFRDVSVALLGNDGNPARVDRLYRAALNRAGDQAGLGYWI